ncbi:MAG: exonuclease SbcCD subunit D C-terminal domain-containing protein, partial [Actinomycetota bacterium]|nr:exonuclease SbcCD subunit D C-terminal domain-containing protein [Actinomycetota bacterium]
YIALGHIHKPQKVKGTAADTRYCGSLLQLDFGERGQDKSLVVVEASAGKPPKVTEVPVEAGRALRELNVTMDSLEAAAATVGDEYLRVNLALDAPVPGIADRVREVLPNALDIRLVLPQRDGEADGPSLRTLDPKSQFVSYYSATHNAEPVDDLLAAFDRVYEEVTG